MIKLKSAKRDNPSIVPASTLRPLQVAQVTKGVHLGEYVMRTASDATYELMNISTAQPCNCWNLKSSEGLYVRILAENERITLEIYND